MNCLLNVFLFCYAIGVFFYPPLYNIGFYGMIFLILVQYRKGNLRTIFVRFNQKYKLWIIVVAAESGKGCVFKKHGMQDTFATIGYAEDLYSYYQFDANGIVDKVREMMGMEFEPDENWDDE